MNPDCLECSGTGWKVITRGGVEGVTRCQCRQPKEVLKPQTPITPEMLAVSLKILGALDKFPVDEIAQGGVGSELAAMCSSAEELEFVTVTALRLYARWHTCHYAGLRQIRSHLGKPKDGKAIDSTPAYPDGIGQALGLPEPPQRRLPIAKGEPASADPELAQLIGQAVKRPPDTGPPLPAARRVVPRPNESDDQALHRAFTEDLARPVPKPRLPTEDEIAEIKRKQAEAAKEDATRAILSKGEGA